MAGLLKKGRYAGEVMQVLDGEERKRFPRSAAMIPVLAGKLMGTRIRKKIVISLPAGAPA